MTRTKLVARCLAAAFIAAGIGRAAAPSVIPLAGAWRFQLDRSDAGIAGQWYARELPGRIELPGSLPAQGVGDDITPQTPWIGGVRRSSWFTAPEYAKYRQPGNVKVPFWLQPGKYYSGAAWYQRTVDLPADWAGRRVVLSLERPHWETRAWLDGRLLGRNDSLSTPHEYDLGSPAPGRHVLTLRVDNRMIVDIGENSHAISDNTQGDWNGVVGRIELRAGPPVWLDDVQVFPNVAKRSALVRIHIGNATGRGGAGELTVGDRVQPVRWGPEGGEASAVIALGENAGLWDEFQPVLQHVRVALSGESGTDERVVTFGLREISTVGTQFAINGRRTFLRGTLECCVFPRTGHPPTDVEDWKRIIRVAKSCGLNLFRFHSWCPPEAAFVAADELGFYFQIETCWANQSTTLGDGRPVDAWVYAETDRILKAYGNHPSFLLMAYGNEPGSRTARPNSAHSSDYHGGFDAYLAGYVDHFKALDPRRLWTSASGWPQLPENQFDVTPDPRIYAWSEGLNSRINGRPPETTTDYRDYISRRRVPVVSHEIGQWCVYPDFDEIPKYTGYLQPKNFEIFRDTLAAHHLEGLAHEFLLASGRLQLLCYKEEVESALRTPGMGGFELLGLTDFPGQGTALVGVLDPFWDPKGYATPEEFSRFCNSTVPLARLAKRVFTTDEALMARIEVAHFGPLPLAGAVVEWKLVDDGDRALAQGAFPAADIPIGNGCAVGSLRVDLKDARAPARYRLVVDLAGTKFQNDWNVWVYPARPPVEPADIRVTSNFDDDARRCLEAGGKVLLTLPAGRVRNYDRDPVKLGFSSIFWNTAWTNRQAPTTLGILCDPKHPALAEFPTEFCSDWQWWYLIHRAGALRLDLLPPGVEPIVRVIDDWVTARPLGLVVEARVGAGRIVICGFDLTRGADDPVSRQMRASLLAYMDSRAFAPAAEISAAGIESLIAGSKRPADAQEVTLDPANRGRTFEGLGAVSAGASSRLLVDYPEPQRGQILDYLFKPDYGASLQHLKVEIGGDINSTDGTEPSHMRTRDDLDFHRGYEWWLMREAKARNPDILLDSLPWGAPGWVGGGHYYSRDMADYIVRFIQGAKQEYGLNLDYTGVHNESAYVPGWIVLLRSELDAAGLRSVKIVGGDEWKAGWKIVDRLKASPALAAAVAVVGAHYPQSSSPAEAKRLSQPLWASEDGPGGGSWRRALQLAQKYNRNYIEGRMTKTEIWSPVTSYYDNLPAPESGLMKANSPWSGAYEVSPAIWATAHTTQFARPGWRYLGGQGCGYLKEKGAIVGSYVSLESPDGRDYSIVAETADATVPHAVVFRLRPGPFPGPVHVWRTQAAAFFVRQPDAEPVDGGVAIALAPGSIYSLTTTTGQGKGTAVPPPPRPFPMPYAEDFDGYAAGATPKYLSDQAGAFEVAARPDGGGNCLRQALTQPGIPWAAQFRPYTILGDMRWRDYTVGADVMIPAGHMAFLLGRVGRIAGFNRSSPPAYWLAVSDGPGAWEIRDTAQNRVIARGRMELAANTWHHLELSFVGDLIEARVDGSLAGRFRDSAHPSGMAGLGCDWSEARFSHLRIAPAP